MKVAILVLAILILPVVLGAVSEYSTISIPLNRSFISLHEVASSSPDTLFIETNLMTLGTWDGSDTRRHGVGNINSTYLESYIFDNYGINFSQTTNFVNASFGISINKTNGDAELNLSIHRIFSDFDKGYFTWNSNSSSTSWLQKGLGLGNDYNATSVSNVVPCNITVASQQQSYCTFDVTSFMDNWIENGIDFSFLIRQLEEANYSTNHRFSFNKYPNSTASPYLLNITYTSVSSDFISSVYETELSTFNISFIDLNVTSVILSYNNTNYTVSGVDTNWSVSVHTTLLNSTTSPQDVSFFWYYQLGSGLWQNTANNTQQVSSIILDPCAGASNVTATFAYYNEQSPGSAINGRGLVTLNYGLSPSSRYKNISFETSSATSHTLCIHPSDQTYYADVEWVYNTSGGFNHKYYLFNQSLSNVSQTFDLYNFNTQTDISDLRITTRNQTTFLPYPNLVARLERFYPSIGTYKVVQMDLTSSETGLAFFNIEEESVDYRLSFYNQHNQLLKRSDKLGFSCDLGICEVTVLIPVGVVSATEDFITVSAGYTNSTGTYSLNWTTLEEDGSSTVTLLVTQNNPKGKVEICRETQTGSGGEFVCNYLGYDGTLEVQVTVANSVHYVFSQFIIVGREMLSQFINLETGSFLGIIMLMFIVPAGAFISPGIGIGVSVFAVLGMFYMGFMSYITLTFVVILSVISVLVAWWVKD